MRKEGNNLLLDGKIFDSWLGYISQTSNVNQYRPKVTRYFERNKNIDFIVWI
ncbi:MAG: hypothetical protein K0R54_3637 [Clostridiaceae bacterium]|jgi:hypothetical protein|nr:hypothetical protein [Clostridiaceae bacterium]